MTPNDIEERKRKLEEISEWILAAEKRAEEAEERMLDEMIAKVQAENMRILETEWADHKDMWEWMLQQGKTPREALDFLNSFA